MENKDAEEKNRTTNSSMPRAVQTFQDEPDHIINLIEAEKTQKTSVFDTIQEKIHYLEGTIFDLQSNLESLRREFEQFKENQERQHLLDPLNRITNIQTDERNILSNLYSTALCPNQDSSLTAPSLPPPPPPPPPPLPPAYQSPERRLVIKKR